MATVTINPDYYLAMDQSDPRYIFSTVTYYDSNTYEISSDVSTFVLELSGSFTYDIYDNITGGTINHILETDDYLPDLTYTGCSIDVIQFLSYLTTTENHFALYALVSTGNDLIKGGNYADHLYGFGGNDTILGNGGNDRLFGMDGNDTLSGSGGADVLTGGPGKDTLNGGAAADHFDFNAPTESTVANFDTIQGFSAAQHDRIDLRTIDATASGINNAFHFAGSQSFAAFNATHNGGVVRAVAGLVQVDVGGNGTVDMVIKTPGVTLHATDFFL